MATFSYTYTLTNGTTADATQVQQNFTDVRNGVSDGTSDISCAALTASGNFTANGTTNTIGNASSDDFVLTASLASSVAIKTDSTYSIGTTSTRVANIYADMLYATGLGTATAKSADYTVLDQDNINVILMTTGASDRTVTLPTAADNTNRVLFIKKVDSGTGNVIVDGEGAETIDDASTLTLGSMFASCAVVCDGSAWHSIHRPVRFQRKILAADQTSNATMTDLSFTTVAGRTYRITFNGKAVTTTSNTAVVCNILDNATTIGSVNIEHGNATTTNDTSWSIVYKMTSTSLTFVAASCDVNGYWDGTGTLAGTFAMIEELPDHVAHTFA